MRTTQKLSLAMALGILLSHIDGFVTAIKTKAWSFLKEWSEPVTIPMAIAAFYMIGRCIELAYPGQPGVPPVLLHVIPLIATFLVAINMLAWLGIKINFPGIYDFYRDGITQSFTQLTNIQKVCVTVFLYCFLVFCSVLLATKLV